MVFQTKEVLSSAPAASYCMWVFFSCGCCLLNDMMPIIISVIVDI